MVEGVTLDRTYGSVLPSTWMEGAAIKGWTGSLKMKGKTQIDIKTYRCAACGYLESYAAQPLGGIT